MIGWQQLISHALTAQAVCAIGYECYYTGMFLVQATLLKEIFFKELLFWTSCWCCVGKEGQPTAQNAHKFNIRTSAESFLL